MSDDGWMKPSSREPWTVQIPLGEVKLEALAIMCGLPPEAAESVEAFQAALAELPVDEDEKYPGTFLHGKWYGRDEQGFTDCTRCGGEIQCGNIVRPGALGWEHDDCEGGEE